MRQIFKIGVALIGLTVLSACASNRVDFGGVMSQAAVPAQTVSCEDASWTLAHEVDPEYPRALMHFLFFNQTRADTRNLVYTFDINERGETRNIVFDQPRHYLEHRALQYAILSGAEALSEFRYAHDGQDRPIYTTGCVNTVTFSAVYLMN